MPDNKDLDDLDQRADRLLDGMAVNRDKLVRDLKTATVELRRWRAAFDRMKREGKAKGFEDLFAGFGARRG